MRYYIFIIIFLNIGLFSCKKIRTVQAPCEVIQVNIPQDTSFLSTPLIIPTQLIEDKLNLLIRHDILSDSNFIGRRKNGKKDKMKMKITRLGDIQVTWKDNIATYQAPLLVLIERQIVNKNILPLPKSLAFKTEFSLRLVFETRIDLGEDWKLQPKTKFVSFKWLSKVEALGGLFNIENMVERRLHRQMPEILDNMDFAIRANIHLDSTITRVWQKIQKPVIINRATELVWLKINPIQFEMGTITTQAGNLMIQGRLSATTQTLVGANPAYTIDSVLPPLLKRRILPDTGYVYFLSEISYSDIHQVLARKLVGQVFDVSGRKIKIKEAEIWGCGPNLVLHLNVRGDLRGDIYFQGIPHYDPDAQQIVIQNLNYEIQTEAALLNSADWLLHSTFNDMLKNTLTIPMTQEPGKIPQAIMQGIERGASGEKMDFFIEEWDCKPQKIWVRPSDIALLVIVHARVRVELEKI